VRNSLSKAEPGLTLCLPLRASAPSLLGHRLLPFPLLSPVAVKGQIWCQAGKIPSSLCTARQVSRRLNRGEWITGFEQKE